MNTYLIHGFIIKSEFLLNFIEMIESAVVDIIIHSGEILMPVKLEIDDSDQEASYIVDKNSNEIYFSFKNQGNFLIKNGNEIIVDLYKGHTYQVLEDIILRRCLHFIFYQRDILVMHCSGIVYNEECLLLAGESGVGKSTITEKLISDGLKYIGDDQVRILNENGTVLGIPSFPRRKIQESGIDLLGKNKSHYQKVPNLIPTKYNIFDNDNFTKTLVDIKKFVIIVSVDCKEVHIRQLEKAEKLNRIVASEYGRFLNNGLDVNKKVFL